jgi:hypothetical protein
MENTEENCEKIWKIWKKCKLKSEMIWKIWKISVCHNYTQRDQLAYDVTERFESTIDR